MSTDGPLRFVRGDVVVVPADLAEPLLRVLSPLVTARGEPLSRDLLELLQALALAAVVTPSPTRNSAGPVASLEEPDVQRLPARDAAAAVGLTPRRVQQLCASGKVRHERVGSRVLLVDTDDLHRYIQQRGERE